MIWCELVTLELRKVEACAREEEHNKVQDDGNCRWFYRQHLEQERGVTCPLEGKQVDEDFIIFETFIPKQTNKGKQTRVADSAETVKTMASLPN